MTLSIPLKLLLSLLIGAAIGLERESYERKIDTTDTSGEGSLGIRSFALITLLGTTASLLIAEYFSIFLLISITFAVLLTAYYIIGSKVIKDHGLTTELGVLWSYFIGLLIGIEFIPIQVIIALTVVVILILSSKTKIKTFVAGIKEYELEAFISYAIIALVVLPFLPNISFTLTQMPFLSGILTSFGVEHSRIATMELVNPFSVWRVVAIITGVEILGYLMERTLGQKSGWILTSIIGGFVSSTSTTQSLAQQSQKIKNENRLLASAVIANLASFFQLIVLLGTVNSRFLVQFFPSIAGLILSGIIISLYFSRYASKQKESPQSLKEKRIFSLAPALQFAALFMGIKIATKTSLVFFGDSGFIVSNILGAVSGMDAVSINIAQLAGEIVSYQTALLTLILANAVNLLSKVTYSFMYGTRTFAMQFLVSALLMIAASFVGLVF